MNPNDFVYLNAGAVCEHYDYFRGQRGTRIDRSTVETNKLLIRLEKLVKFNVECSEPSKRKGKRARKGMEKKKCVFSLQKVTFSNYNQNSRHLFSHSHLKIKKPD